MKTKKKKKCRDHFEALSKSVSWTIFSHLKKLHLRDDDMNYYEKSTSNTKMLLISTPKKKILTLKKAKSENDKEQNYWILPTPKKEKNEAGFWLFSTPLFYSRVYEFR